MTRPRRGRCGYPMKARRITLEQFVAQHGMGMIPDTCELHRLPGLHGRARKRAMEEGRRRCAQHGIELERLRAEYDRLVETGEIVPPTAEERLEETARGNAESEQVQAARRVLVKRAARREERETALPVEFGQRGGSKMWK